jgi:hypothetical protein
MSDATEYAAEIREREAYKRALDAMTLEEVWPIIMRAYRDRRQNPEPWRFIANNVRIARSFR